ncbi:MAG: alpha/beta fold hydrolase [Acidobacteriota bacterium]
MTAASPDRSPRRRRFTIGPVDTAVLEVGDGPPIVLLHGNPDSAELWRDVTPKLNGFRCLMPDLPGFGHSKILGPYPFTLDAHVEWLRGLLDALDVRAPVHLVVHDFGGPFGLAWAVRHPQQVASVLLSDTIFMSGYRWHFWARLWRTRVLGEITMPLMGWPIFRWELRRGSKNLPDAHLRRTWALVTPAVKRTVLQLYRATDPDVFLGWEDELRGLLRDRPSLALWGERDPYIDPRWADTFGADTAEIVPKCGHWLPAEVPDLFADRLLRLVASC